ncbi:MAG: hypothetical protein CL489_10410 [Acidobacteria bacterium]|nr:hypothetical protein [Acidobacteriota bacterium]|tara:strand:+ start:19194 stop:19958 length:765 start_codon:yes stop_codon:yes gene_type:complete
MNDYKHQFETYSGKMITVGFQDGDSFQPEDFVLADIARGLAAQTRYNGQQEKLIPVAAHTLLCVALAEELYPNISIEQLYEILHHDDAEAYIGDMPKDFKLLCPQFEALEKRILKEGICPGLGFSHQFSSITKEVDNLAILYEKIFVHGAKSKHSDRRVEGMIKLLNDVNDRYYTTVESWLQNLDVEWGCFPNNWRQYIETHTKIGLSEDLTKILTEMEEEISWKRWERKWLNKHHQLEWKLDKSKALRNDLRD